MLRNVIRKIYKSLQKFLGIKSPSEIYYPKGCEMPPAGLYPKYHPIKKIGDIEGKHNDCFFFVLDITHDPHAIPAILAYADSVENEYPELAEDLRIVVKIEKENKS